MTSAEVTPLEQMGLAEARLDRRFPPGRVGVISADLARYHSFTMSLVGMKYPYGSDIHNQRGCDIVDSCNKIVRTHMATPAEDWVWFMGDDHVFDTNLLPRLLARMYQDGCDLVAPCVLSRQPPFPTVMGTLDEQAKRVNVIPLQEATGLQKVDCVGSAGLLVRKRVFQALGDPWFEAGSLVRSGLGEDWHFCLKAKAAGFQTYVDMGLAMGHTIDATIWPYQDPGECGVRLSFGGSLDLKVAQTVHSA